MTGRHIAIMSHARRDIFFVIALWLDAFVVGIPLEFLHERYAEPTKNIVQIESLRTNSPSLRHVHPTQEEVQEARPMTKESKKCAHPACSCMAPEGKKYCSAPCESAKKMTELSCQCEHPACTGSQLKA